MPDGGRKTRIGSEMIARASAGMKSLRDGALGFFTPVKPQPPVAQSTMGRQFDYDMSFNISNKPRRDERDGRGVTFEQLRALADNYDLLRLVIETRKDQLCGLTWNVVGRDPDDKIKNDDKRVKEIEEFLRFPDRNVTWNDWLRQIVEDLLVIDAPTIYPRKKVGGGLYSLDIVDGGTIKLLINDDGRTPIAPEPAYTQIIKGMNAVHYTTDELIYVPRNRRSWKMYGMSPVEQIIMTVNIALRRQLNQLEYYTEGNIPEAFAGVPEAWTPEQVKQMQIIWDSLIEGDQSAKRKMKFLPGGVAVQFTRESILKDQFDEWLARIVCYAFSVSPQALIQMMNRATAESAAETAQLEGLAPLQIWVKDLVDRIIVKQFGYDDLVFEWDSGEELDPKSQAEIHGIYLDKMVLDVDEVRKDIGRDPRTIPALPAPVEGAPVPEGGVHGALPDGQQPGIGAGENAVVAAGAPSPDGTNVPTAAEASGTTQPAGASATGGTDTSIQDTAMNGTQISSLLEIISEVAHNEIPEATAKAMINAAFPYISGELVDAMIAGLEAWEPPKPEPVLGPDGQPIAPAIPGKGQKAGATPSSGVQEPKPKPGQDDPPAKGKDGEPAAKDKLAKGKGIEPQPSKVRRAQQKALRETMVKVLAAVGESIAKQVAGMRDEVIANELAKADKDVMDYIKSLLAKLDFSGFDDAVDDLTATLSITATAAARDSLEKMVSDADQDMFNLANTRAEKYAEARAAELIKSGADGGELLDSTRDMIRGTILKAEEEGWSNQHLSKELQDSYAFSKQRADTIARTETKMADSEGMLAGWRESGLKMNKRWVRSANDYECDICQANEDQGEIPLEDVFDSGDVTTPAHPNCECIVRSVLDKDQKI